MIRGISIIICRLYSVTINYLRYFYSFIIQSLGFNAGALFNSSNLFNNITRSAGLEIFLPSTTITENGLSLDLNFYRESCQDLNLFSDKELLEHYTHYGELEGRISSPLAIREELLKLIMEFNSVLEIGPFNNPAITGENVKYFDVMDHNELKRKARDIGLSAKHVPKIDYLSSVGDLSVIKHDKFDALISCHCVEHTIDIIDHFFSASNILKDGGCYFLIIPDKRYCFDYFRPESNIDDVLMASKQKLTKHSLANIVEYHTLSTHNDASLHWGGDHGLPLVVHYPNLISKTIIEYQSSEQCYFDVHNWKFTPRGFYNIFSNKCVVELTKLMPICVFGTPRNEFEFCAILRKL